MLHNSCDRVDCLQRRPALWLKRDINCGWRKYSLPTDLTRHRKCLETIHYGHILKGNRNMTRMLSLGICQFGFTPSEYKASKNSWHEPRGNDTENIDCSCSYLDSVLKSAKCMLRDMKPDSMSRSFRLSSGSRYFISVSCHKHKPLILFICQSQQTLMQAVKCATWKTANRYLLIKVCTNEHSRLQCSKISVFEISVCRYSSKTVLQLNTHTLQVFAKPKD